MDRPAPPADPTVGSADPARRAPTPGPVPADLAAVEGALTRLTRALRRVRGHGNQHLGGLTMPQFHLVEPLLDAPGPLPVGTLAERAATAAPTATAMARKLQTHGIVSRSADPEDGRIVRLELTEEGRRAAQERRDVVRAWRLRIVQAVEPEDREVAVRVLGVLAGEVEATAEKLAALGRTTDVVPPPVP